MKKLLIIIILIVVGILGIIGGYYVATITRDKKINNNSSSKDCDGIEGGAYTVSFDTNGGLELDSQVVCIACAPDSYSDIPKAEKDGYIFEGWYYDKELTQKVTGSRLDDIKSSQKKENGCTVGYNDIVLYAKYIKNESAEKEAFCSKYKNYSSNETDNKLIYETCVSSYEQWELVEDTNRSMGLTVLDSNDDTRITNKTTSDFAEYAKRFAHFTSDMVRDNSEFKLYLLEIYMGINYGDSCTLIKTMNEVGTQLFGNEFDVTKYLDKKYTSDNYYCVLGHQGYQADPYNLKVVSKDETTDAASITVDAYGVMMEDKDFRLKINFNIKNGLYVFDSYELVK